MKRVLLCSLITIVIALGLSSRRHEFWPGIFKEYGGDALYAVLIYLLTLVVVPTLRPHRTGLFAVSLCFVIEFSQAVHWPWLDQLRSHRLVALVLGQGFVWSDLVMYTIGASVAYLAHCKVAQTWPDP